MIKRFDIPILFIIFRRKDTALQVIRAIAKVKPETLYISQDGPQNEKEKKEVLEVRKAVLSRVNWDCKLTMWTYKKNLGLKKHIPKALDKFFKDNECGIYLEDDTVPSNEFFYFEKELLQKYKNDERIFAVNGTNLYPSLIRNKYSYYLSQLGCFWGVGMWKRSWKLYDSKMSDLKSFRFYNYKDFIFSRNFFLYLKVFLNLIKENKLNTWDYQLTYSAIKNKKYFLAPSVNLVKNIGFGKTSTDPFLQKYKTRTYFVKKFRLNHPNKLIYDKAVDKIYFKEMYKLFHIRILLTVLFFTFPCKMRKNIARFIKFINNV
jgi:hypothetical protein